MYRGHKRHANLAGLQGLNYIFKFTGNGEFSGNVELKYTRQDFKQNRWYVWWTIRPTLGSPLVHYAVAASANI